MKVNEVLQCSLPSWYPLFEKVTFPTVCVPLPSEVLEYLRHNGSLVLPLECNGESYDGKEDDYDDFGDVDWNEQEESEKSDQKSFPEFSQTVQKHINDYGGDVFIKLNWSAPKDATWVAFNNNMKCSSLSQLYLLLKSSDFIAHDLTQPFKDCDDASTEDIDNVQYSLVIRQWNDINPGTEFRDVSNFYPHIGVEAEAIKQDILTFHSEHISNRLELSQYVMDVVRPSKDQVLLVDINPWGDTTDSLMFSLEELDTVSVSSSSQPRDGVVFRYIKESGGVMPHPYRQYSLPRDVIDLATGDDPDTLIDFLRLKQRTENGDNSEDSDQEL